MNFWSQIPSWHFVTWKGIPWGQKTRLQTFAVPLLGQLTARCLGFVFISPSSCMSISHICLILDQVCKKRCLFQSSSSPKHLLISTYILAFPPICICILAFARCAGPLCFLKYRLPPFTHFLSHPCPPDSIQFSSILMKVSTFSHSRLIFFSIYRYSFFHRLFPLFLSKAPLLKDI